MILPSLCATDFPLEEKATLAEPVAHKETLNDFTRLSR